MKYELINQPNDKYSAKQQILINRGLKEEDIPHYMNLTDDDINDPEIFGDVIVRAARVFKDTIDNPENVICVVVDSDCDGYTSAAVMINYIYDVAPDVAVSRLHYFHHEGKQHGLQDAMDWIADCGADLVIVPDGGSNDWNELQKLYEDGREVIILDHHIIEGEAFPHCYLINSQLPQYPNKELSGVGVTWQFCRFVDKLYGTSYADNYLDLVALGCTGDMMSLKSFETRRLISKGLEPERITNPFIYEMWQKNKFKLGDNPTTWGETFYIVPFVNAITRSGTMEEKDLIFKSMLKFEAFKQIPSNKRGHKIGEMERLVDQAIRTCTNVKNRQGRTETAALELVEHLIEDNHMMEHKVLLFLLEPGQVKPEVRGLVANKLMSKYQRPCCMLTKTIEKDKVSYQGSIRGCDKVGVVNFKDICANTGVVDYVVGHQGAAGMGLPASKIDAFITSTDEQLKDMSSEPIYYVDYIWSPAQANKQAILDIADMADMWGKDIDESIVAIQGIQVTKDNLTMMASNTVKITLSNGVSLIKFRIPDEEYDKLYSEYGYVEIDVIGTANCNEWGGNKYAQIIITDYSIIKRCAYIF